MMTGSPSRPLSSVTICCMADNSATIYRNIVTKVQKLRKMAAGMPYLCLVHSVRTNPSGHFFLIIGPRKAKIKSGAAELNAYTINPWTPAIVASCGYAKRIPEPRAFCQKKR